MGEIKLPTTAVKLLWMTRAVFRIEQGLANDSPRNKSGLPPVFINTILLIHSSVYPFMYCQWQLLVHSGPQCCLALYRNGILVPCLEMVFLHSWGHIFLSAPSDALCIVRFLHLGCWECEVFLALCEL